MGINDSIDGVVKTVLDDLGIPLPGGDPDAIRTIAGQWDTMGTNLTQLSTTLGYHVNQLESDDWSGDARDGFDQHWDNHSQSIDDMATKFHDVCKGLHDYADEIEEINNEIIDTCVELAEMIAAGAALTFVTAGISDLVGDAAAVSRGIKLAELVEKFAKAAEKIGKWLKKMWDLIKDALKAFGKKAETFGKGFAENVFSKKGAVNFVGNWVSNTGSQAWSQHNQGKDVDWVHDVIDGGVAAAGSTITNGVIGGLGGNPATVLSGAASNAAGGEVDDLADNATPKNWGFTHHDGRGQAEDAVFNLGAGATGNFANSATGDDLLSQAGGTAVNTFINTKTNDNKIQWQQQNDPTEAQ